MHVEFCAVNQSLNNFQKIKNRLLRQAAFLLRQAGAASFQAFCRRTLKIFGIARPISD